ALALSPHNRAAGAAASAASLQDKRSSKPKRKSGSSNLLAASSPAGAAAASPHLPAANASVLLDDFPAANDEIGSLASLPSTISSSTASKGTTLRTRKSTKAGSFARRRSVGAPGSTSGTTRVSRNIKVTSHKKISLGAGGHNTCSTTQFNHDVLHPSKHRTTTSRSSTGAAEVLTLSQAPAAPGGTTSSPPGSISSSSKGTVVSCSTGGSPEVDDNVMATDRGVDHRQQLTAACRSSRGTRTTA
ncbi:unnamed protein product, partial [Amoebophrya sp. A120]